MPLSLVDGATYTPLSARVRSYGGRNQQGSPPAMPSVFPSISTFAEVMQPPAVFALQRRCARAAPVLCESPRGPRLTLAAVRSRFLISRRSVPGSGSHRSCELHDPGRRERPPLPRSPRGLSTGALLSAQVALRFDYSVAGNQIPQGLRAVNVGVQENL
ncbi:hypothetical protein NDU88_009555 [Pleurodeles waltl]|uniref:Uncharacterized protein n=1 Tax=Pleurodeles waltl TaxID=8319 RepID=A0AAV7S0Q2_PLEWA|nr:hypothetical protein NDU88_009555 [Pleurodeles waltl]